MWPWSHLPVRHGLYPTLLFQIWPWPYSPHSNVSEKTLTPPTCDLDPTLPFQMWHWPDSLVSGVTLTGYHLSRLCKQWPWPHNYSLSEVTLSWLIYVSVTLTSLSYLYRTWPWPHLLVSDVTLIPLSLLLSVSSILNFSHDQSSVVISMPSSMVTWDTIAPVELMTMIWPSVVPNNTCKRSNTEIIKSHIVRKPVFGFATKYDTNWPAQLQGLAGVLKFWVWHQQVLYYQAVNNKAADRTVQMCRLICPFAVSIIMS